MNAIIFGNGIVGKATALVLERAGITAKFWDVVPERQTCAWGDVLGADVIFLCLSTMVSVADDSRLVYEEVQRLDNLGYLGQFVLRTTCAPGTADRACKDFALPRRFASWPEFLREAHWEDDALRPDRVILGIPRHGPWPAPTEAESPVPLLKAVAAKVFPEAPVHELSLTQAELAKLVANAFLALRLSAWNEVQRRFRDDVDAALVGAVADDPRLWSFGDLFFGEPWGGRCLSKDVPYLAGLVPGGVLAGAQAVNERLLHERERLRALGEAKAAALTVPRLAHKHTRSRPKRRQREQDTPQADVEPIPTGPPPEPLYLQTKRALRAVTATAEPREETTDA